MPGLLEGPTPGGVHHTAAAVFDGVGVQRLGVKARFRDADAVAAPRHGSEIRRHHQVVVAVSRPPQEDDYGLVSTLEIHPFEAGPIEVHFVERALPPVKQVQIGHQTLERAVRIVVEQIPVEALVRVPLHPLPEFAAHKQQLLARMRVLEGVERAQVCKLLPGITRHFCEQRALAVHDFIVREDEDKIFREGVEQ